jgi:hypothetical protein
MEQLQEELRKMQIESESEEEEQPQQKKGVYTRRKPKEDDKRTTTSKSNIAKARASKLEKLKAMKKDRLEQELAKIESNSYEIQEEQTDSDSSDSSDGGEGFILKKVYEKPEKKKAGKGKSHKEKYDENKRMDKIESILEHLSKQKAMREKPAKKVEKKTIIQIQQPQRQNNEQVDHLKKQILLKL